LLNYIKNLETGKIELHFEKSDYLALSDELKKEIKSSYLFSKSANAWVSRGIHNQYRAIQTAIKLGFTEEEKQGERLTFAEQLERKQEKAEHRAERYDQYAVNAINRAKILQSELESHHGDNSFFTQPIIAGHAGSQAFGKRRQKIYDRYHKGFEEYKKSEYFAEKAEIARMTADATQLKSPIYLNNRIEECEKRIRKIEKNVESYEDILTKKNNNETVSSFYENKTEEQIQDYLNESLDRLEYEVDKLGYFQNCMKEIKTKLEENGQKMYNKSDIKPGYLFLNYRHKVWAKVIRVNPKTITATYIEHPLTGHDASCPYTEIKEVKIPENWTDEKEVKAENPFKVGDIVCKHRPADNSIYRAYQIVKTTEKSVTIQRIEVLDHKPIKDTFISDQQERKQVKKDRGGNFVINHDDWYLYKYSA